MEELYERGFGFLQALRDDWLAQIVGTIEESIFIIKVPTCSREVVAYFSGKMRANVFQPDEVWISK